MTYEGNVLDVLIVGAGLAAADELRSLRRMNGIDDKTLIEKSRSQLVGLGVLSDTDVAVGRVQL